MTTYVRCRSCSVTTRRNVREVDGTFGPCHKCGGVMAPRERFENARYRQAKMDLARFALEQGNPETGSTR